MNITQVYLTPNYETEDAAFRVKYQNQTTYLQLFIEDCLRKKKIDIGKFNRLVFSEGGDKAHDFTIVGNNTMPVALEKTYEKLQKYENDREFHNYFVLKFLEGFKKFDAHFSTSTAEYLAPLIDEKYENELTYEKKMATKKIGNLRLQAIGCYTKDYFKLILKAFEKNKLVKSHVAFECEPDMFVVRYDVNKVEISETQILVINKVREITVQLSIKEFI